MIRIPIFKAAIYQHNAIHRALHNPRSISLTRYNRCQKTGDLRYKPLTNSLKTYHIHEKSQQRRRYCSNKGTPHGSTVSAWNAANAVTVGRIIAAPFTAYSITTGAYDWALGGLLYAGVSDWLDGVLARRYGLQTVVGSYLDPAADKLLISTATIALACQDVIPTWLLSLIIGRDVAIVTGSMILMRRKKDTRSKAMSQIDLGEAIEPHFISKVNTTCQIAFMFAAVVHAGDWGLVSAPALEGIGIATAITTTSSGVMYSRTFWKHYQSFIKC